jgi:hypothetical protein
MSSKALAAFAVLSAVAAQAPAIAHPPAPTPAVGHCVDIGPVYVLGQMVLDTYEICVPV